MAGSNGSDARGASSGGAPGRADYGAYPGGPPFGQEPEGLTLRDYLSILWRRKWIILAVVVVATASAYFFAARQPKVYEASADLIYEKQVDLSNPLTGQGYSDPNERTSQLQSVGNIIASPDMRQRAQTQLSVEGESGAGFTVSSAPLTDSTSSSTSYASSVVRITATSGNPKLSAAAANAYAVAFVDYRREIVKTQIQRGIDAINNRMNTYPDGARSSTDYLVLQQRLRDLQLSRDTATGNFRVLVPATVPAAPIAPKPMRSAILGFGVGLFAAIGLAFLLEQFDTRLRRTEDVALVLRQPLLGRIPRISHKLRLEGGVVSLKHPGGSVAEAFRMVRTNLDFMNVEGSIRSLLITSCVQGEGKSVAASNLAVTMAMAGKKVMLIDCDLRRPRQHQYFGVPNDAGVSTVVTGQHKLSEALVPIEVAQAAAGGTPDSMPAFNAWAEGADARSRMYVLPSGPIPPNPGEIVASARLGAIIDQLTREADIVIVDTPAMLPVGDTSAIAPRVDGLVFLVDMGVVKRPQLSVAADQLARLPVRMLGTVVRVAHSGGHYSYRYGGYRYGGYSYAYSENGKGSKKKGEKAAASAAATASAAAVAAPGAMAASSGAGRVVAPLVAPVTGGAVAPAAAEPVGTYTALFDVPEFEPPTRAGDGAASAVVLPSVPATAPAAPAARPQVPASDRVTPEDHAATDAAPGSRG